MQRFIIDSDFSKISSRLYLNLADLTEPKVDLVVKSKLLNTAFFTSETSADENAEFSWSKKPFNFLGLGRFRGDAKLYINKFIHNDFELSEFVVDGTFEEDIFNLNNANFSLYDGIVEIKGQVGISEKNPSLAASVRASNVDVSKMLKNAKMGGDTKGIFYLSGTMATFGLNAHEWILNIKTKAKIAAKNFVFSGIDFDSIIKKSRVTFSAIDMAAIVKKAVSGGSTSFSTLSGEIYTNKGILNIKEVAIQNKFSKGVFVGNINMLNGDIRAVSKIAFKPEANKNVHIDVNLSGDLKDIKKTIDTTNLEQYITEKGLAK